MIEYQNGNCCVSIDTNDGTKTRSCDGIPRPEFPESIDLKITNQCDIGCDFCHESAVSNGNHANPINLVGRVRGLPAGVEIAIGGGNILAYLHLEYVLHRFADKGLISNITLHINHAIRHSGHIERFRKESLIYGVGISGCQCTVDMIEQMAPRLFDVNTVVHFVAGIDRPFDVVRMGSGRKILILGYKRRGRGKDFYDEKVKRNLDEWAYFLPTILDKEDIIISFDNLALKQLPVQRHVSPEVWQSNYMGDDGQFSMFVDAVQMEYAASSADELRQPLNGMMIWEAFKTLVILDS